MLEGLGLDPLEGQVYVALLDGSSSIAELSHGLDVTAERIRRALRALESKGFASRIPGRAARYAPARPDLAVEALIVRREEEHARARRDVRLLTERYSAVESVDRPIELVRGREAVAQWWAQVQRSATSEVLMFDRPPYVMPFRGPNPVEMELLQSGVAYRVLYDESSFDHEGKREAAAACAQAGEEGRVWAGVPIKLIVADRRLALTYHGSDVRETAVVIRPSAVLSAIVALFDSLWRDAAPLAGTQGGSDGFDNTDLAIVAMLAAGSIDERIARHLGIGVRTVRRRVARIVEQLGAETRFQAAVLATRKGLI